MENVVFFPVGKRKEINLFRFSSGRTGKTKTFE